MAMTNRNREGIRLIARWWLPKAQQALDHPLHLILRGSSVAGHGNLHGSGSTFGGRDSGTAAGSEGGATRLAEEQRRARVTGNEDSLQGRVVWSGLRDHVLESLHDPGESRREAIPARPDHASRNSNQPRPDQIDHAVARGPQAWIDSQGAHALPPRGTTPEPASARFRHPHHLGL